MQALQANACDEKTFGIILAAAPRSEQWLERMERERPEGAGM